MEVLKRYFPNYHITICSSSHIITLSRHILYNRFSDAFTRILVLWQCDISTINYVVVFVSLHSILSYQLLHAHYILINVLYLLSHPTYHIYTARDGNGQDHPSQYKAVWPKLVLLFIGPPLNTMLEATRTPYELRYFYYICPPAKNSHSGYYRSQAIFYNIKSKL